jgi:crossover junction endodeoxyribonuclease RusA
MTDTWLTPGKLAGTTEYRILIPSLPLININDERKMHYRVRGPKRLALRTAAREAAEGLPTMSLARVLCYVTRSTRGYRWDPGNWYPSAKACVDGFTDACLWPDDSVLHVIGPDMRGMPRERDRPHGRLLFRIVDLSPGGREDVDDG